MSFVFNGHVLDLGRRELQRGQQSIMLEPQVFDLIAFLVLNRNRVISKDDLLAGVWGGRIVSDSALTVRINAARKALGDSGKTQQYIRTFPRKGIRFIADVHEVTSADTPNGIAPPEQNPSEKSLNDLEPSEQAPPDKPSIAVLPFLNLSSSDEHDYFVNGMVEEITSALTRIKWLVVAARNSSFYYGKPPVDVRAVGRQLGVRYVVEGSVRRNGDKIRITAQLIETSKGMHLWAERFDGTLGDIFQLQDEVAGAVANQIQPSLQQTEMKRPDRQSLTSLNAYDLFLRALHSFHLNTNAAIFEALTTLARALELNPTYAPALALFCECQITRAAHGWASLTDEEKLESVCLAKRAVEFGQDEPDALCWAAFTLSIFGREHAEAASIVDRALELAPSAAQGWHARGWINCYQGKFELAIPAFEKALRLSPLDPMSSYFKSGFAIAALGSERFDEAARLATEAILASPQYLLAIRIKIAACGYLGRLKEAGALVDRLVGLQPNFTIKGWKASSPLPAEVQTLVEAGFQRAGWTKG